MNLAEARAMIESMYSTSPSALSAQTNIEPLLFHYFESQAIEPRFADVYLGNISQTHFVSEINLESVKINYAITPSVTSIIPFKLGYIGEVLHLQIPLTEFLPPYGPISDTLNTAYAVSGELSDLQHFQANGFVSIAGRRRGDFNQDGLTNIVDLNALVSHFFRSKSLSENDFDADIVIDDKINILDLSCLINYIFRNGSLY
jgi:hypothetical protein